MEQTQTEKKMAVWIPEGIHTRLAALKQPHEPFYSVISRLMDNYAQKAKESVTVNVGTIE